MAIKMVDRVSNSPSRIPIPVSCQLHKSAASRNGKVHRPSDVRSQHNDNYVKAMCFENGIVDTVAQHKSNLAPRGGGGGGESSLEGAPGESPSKGSGFETFVMTGDMIIKTTALHKSPKKMDSHNKVPYNQSVDGSNGDDDDDEDEDDDEDDDDADICLISAEFNPIAAEKATYERSGAPRHHSFSGPDNPRPVHTPLGRVESAPADSKNDGIINWPSPPLSMSSPPIASPEEFVPSLRQTPSSSMESWDPPELHPLDPASHHAQLATMKESSKHSMSNSDSEHSPEVVESSDEKSSTIASSSSDNEVKSSIVTSKSAEKIVPVARGGHSLVRTSKSHENYLQSGNDMMLVSIDIDDDNLAYSLDTLAYQSSGSSLEKLGAEKDGLVPVSRSLQNSPERRMSEKSDRVFMPGFISLDEPRSIKAKGKEVKSKSADSACCRVEPCVDGASDSDIPLARMTIPNGGGASSSLLEPQSPVSSEARGENRGDAPTSNIVASILNSRIGVESTEEGCGSELGDGKPDFITCLRETIEPDSEFSDSDSVYHQPFKSVDRPSAARLAKRLYNLDGFRKADVARHLCKKNDFSNLVAEEYLQFFDFTGSTLDVALRIFLKQFSLIGETQERERVLAHFSKRYMTSNPNTYNSEDACHTLTCAIMLLNTDLHGQNVGRKMNCNEFIENLCELNDGENFPKEDLRLIYAAIKTEPIEWAPDEDLQEHESVSNERRQVPLSDAPSRLGHNPFLEIPDPTKTTEYKKGYVMRKCCLDPDGRRTSFGKRGWKMFYASLRDMILYLHKDEHGFKKGSLVENSSNAIRIHHSIATRASDYTKKQHVFRLHTSDWAEYLFQTSDSKELQEWMETINFVAASLSAPPLPGGIGSQKKFQRPLMPSTYTKKNMGEQLALHTERVDQLEKELHEHRLCPPEKGAKSRIIHEYIEKESFLESELKRFQTYKYLLQSKLSTYKKEIEPSLVETTIGEDDETTDDGGEKGSPASLASGGGGGGALNNSKNIKTTVQRSLSDSTLCRTMSQRLVKIPSTEHINCLTMVTHL